MTTPATVPGSDATPEPGVDQTPVVAPQMRAKPSRFRLAAGSPAPIYLGIALTVAGFGALAYTWGRVAGTAIVALQMPYIASGGFGGLGLVVVGLLAINLGAKRRDAWQRERRLEELAAILDRRADAREPAGPSG